MKSAIGKWVLGMAFVTCAAAMSSATAQMPVPGMGEWRMAPGELANPGLGNWKLNLGQSKFGSSPAPKSIVVSIEPAGKGIKVVSNAVNADGSKVTTEYTADFDGKDMPLKGSPNADTVSLVRKDGSTTVRTYKKGGKVVETLTRVVAKDGFSFTATIVGTNAKGEPTNATLVFDKS